MTWASGAAATSSSGATAGVRWKSERLVLTIDPSLDQIGSWAESSVEAAAETWQSAGAATPEIAFERGEIEAVGYVPGAKNENGVRFATHGEPLAKGAVAITIVTYNTKTGQILDADVLLNGIYRFDDVVAAGGKGKKAYDVQGVLTHELGHLHGLGDDREHAQAAMYAWSSPGDVSKRALSEPDEQALQALYAEPVDGAVEPSAGSCSSASRRGSGRAWASALVLSVLGAAALGRRNARRAGVLALGLAALAHSASAAPAGDPSDAVALATVSASRSWFDGGLIITELELSDVSCAGACDGFAERVRVAGGQVGEIAQVISHAPVPSVGARVRVEVSASESELGRHRVTPLVTEDTRSE